MWSLQQSNLPYIWVGSFQQSQFVTEKVTLFKSTIPMNSRLVLSRQRVDHFNFNVFGVFACMHDKILPPNQRRVHGRIGTKEYLGAWRDIFSEIADKSVHSSMLQKCRVRLHGWSFNELPWRELRILQEEVPEVRSSILCRDDNDFLGKGYCNDSWWWWNSRGNGMLSS